MNKSRSELLREKTNEILEAYREKGAALRQENHFGRSLSEILNLLLTKDDFDVANLALCKSVLDEAIPMRPTSKKGILGFLNNQARKKRNRIFKRRIKKGSPIRIVSEGDSWFQYPIYLKEIIDWLLEDEDMAIHSLGFAADLFKRMTEDKEYEEALKTNDPSYLMLSGGGNDMLGGGNLAALLIHRSELKGNDHLKPEKYFNHLFDDLMAALQYLYVRLIACVGIKYPSITIICHGYDYAIPSTQKGPGFVKGLLNLLIKNGQWLKIPMKKRGYKDEDEQRMAVRYMINLFNRMFEELTISNVFPHLTYIDLRNTAENQEDWHDEIHLTSEAYKRAALEYKEAIRNAKTKSLISD